MDQVHVCRTCLRVIENSRYVDLDASDSGALEFKSKLEACVPELTINVVKNPVICEPCLISLEAAFEFKKQCLKTEEEIYAYMFDCDGGAIDLQFIAKRDIDSKEGIKIELNDNYLSPFNIPNDINQESFTVDTKYEPPSPPDYNEKEHYESSPADTSENIFADEQVQATDEQVQATDEQVQATDEQVQATDEQVQVTNEQDQNASSSNVEGTPSQNYSLPFCSVPLTPLSEDLVKILQYESLRLPNESKLQKESDGRSLQLQNESKQQKAFLAVVSSQIIYKCFVCKTHYTSKEGLLKHSLTHEGEKITFICYPYSDTTTEPVRTYLHEKVDPKEKRFQCGVCQYGARSSIQIHLRAHIGEKAYCCSLCKFGSVYKQALKTHYVKVHSWTRSELAEKYEEFRSGRGGKSHKRGRPKSKFSANNKNKLKEIKTHKNKNRGKLENNVNPSEKIYKCALCKFSSTSKDKFEEYVKVHSNNKSDKLPDSKETQKSNKTYICVNCKVSANSKNKVENGMVMRSDNKPVKLENSAKTQINVQVDVGISVTLKDKKHKKTDKIKTVYKCANCNFTTVNILELSKHGSNHPNGNLYKCGNCEFAVDNVNRLECHMSTHTILYKFYKCLLCKYRTYQQSEFREHRKVHLEPSDEVSSEELLNHSSEEKDMEVDF